MRNLRKHCRSQANSTNTRDGYMYPGEFHLSRETYIRLQNTELNYLLTIQDDNQSPKLIPIRFACSTSWHFGSTILSWPATSPSGTFLHLPSTIPTM